MTPETRFWARVKKTKTCWIWTGAKNSKGYGDIMINGKHEKSHRYSYLISKGEIPYNKHVLHHCDNPTCVNPEHLWIGTNHENVLDKISKGRDSNKSGKNNPNVKLNGEKVNKIRKLYKQGEHNMVQIGKIFNVNRNVISRVVNQKYWI